MNAHAIIKPLALALAATAVLAAPVQAAKKYKEIDVQNGATISGKVSFEGALPADAVERILITKDPKICGEGEREVVWIDVKDGALRGSFVFINKIKEGKKWAAPSGGKYIIDQKGCRFNPWAQVVQPGPLTIRHSDPGALHNINTREIIGVGKKKEVKRTMFNFGQPEPGDIEQTLKPRRSAFIGINCEAHNFMFGYMMAPKHPYAVVVGDDGSFSLTDVPPGKYSVRAWHPRLGLRKTKIKVAAGDTAEANFSFKAK